MSSKLPNASKPYCLFRNSKVGIAICDINTNCISLTNPTFATIFEKQEEELIGQSLETLLPEHTYIHLSEFTNPKFSNIGEFSFETTYYKKSGFGAQLFIHITLIKDNLLSQEQGEIIVHVTDFGNNQCLRDELLTLTENLPGFAYKYQWDMTTGEEKFLYASKGVSDIYGVSVHEALNNIASIRKVMHPEDLIPFKEAIVESSITLAPFHQEFRVNHPEKGLLWLETKSVPKKNLQNNTIIWHGITVDVTEQKIAEKKLKESEKKYRTLVENAKIPIYRFDKNFKRAYVNSEVEKLVGKSYLELIGKSPFELKLIEDESIDDLKKAFDKVFKTKQMTSVELKFILANNSRKYFMHNLIPEFDNNGEVESILAISIDLTAQKELAQKEEMFRTLAENSPNIIMRYDTDVTRIYANPAFSEQTGIPFEAVSSFKPEKQWGVFLKMLNMSALEYQDRVKHVILTGEKDSFFVEWKHLKDGKIIAHDLNIVAERNCEGKIIGALAIGHNITERKLMLDKLISKEQEFRTLTENLPDNVVRFDKEGNYIYMNSTMEQTLGVKSSFIIGKNIKDIVPQHTEVIKAIKDVQNCENDSLIIHQVITTAKGDTQIHHIKFIAERDKNGNIVTVLGVGRDITKLKTYEEVLKQQKDFQDSLLKGVAKAGMSVNVVENGKYIYTNNQELAIEYGYDESISEINPSFLETIHPDDKEKVALMHQKRLVGEDVPNTYTITQVNKQGERREHEVSVVLIPNTNPIQTLVVTKDVTEQKNIEKRIEFMAHHDILTELPNRLLAKDRAIQALSRANRMQKKVGFLFIDLDNFKTINDSLGHSVGDELLKIVASRLQKCIRASDTISRQGGDEFIIILPDLNSTDEIFPIANKLIVEFKKIFDINNQTLSTTASIGVAVYPEHGDTFEQLLQNADAAMYKAKENGRNTYCVFTQQMKHNMLGIFKMQNDLNEAIEKKEFILHYQPQIDLTHNTIVGVEALIRWKHPLLGMIPPLNFISIAESSGIIVQIGEWVLQEACKQAAIWNKEGKNIVVAVNISAVQFKRGNLVEVVKNALKISGLNPQYLELELTESILISDTETVLNTVKAIKELGVLLSIDDFGTGYSSLAYLKRFAVDKLKIDQSFVRDIVQDKDDATIVKTIIAMAKSFNLKAIAEGVENEAVLSALHEFGCDEVQGYYFAKPMIAHEFENYYEKRIN